MNYKNGSMIIFDDNTRRNYLRFMRMIHTIYSFIYSSDIQNKNRIAHKVCLKVQNMMVRSIIKNTKSYIKYFNMDPS